MGDLEVCIGPAVRDAFCRAFDDARSTIDAEFHRLDDRAIGAALAQARARHVKVVEHVAPQGDDYGNPAGALHAKAAVVDDAVALIATANFNVDGVWAPGDIGIVDRDEADASEVERAIRHRGAAPKASRIIAGPAARTRATIDSLLSSACDVSIAAEGLSDPKIVARLLARRAAGACDRVLVNGRGRVSGFERRELRRLTSGGVDVRTLRNEYMHEKYVDGGDRIYVGSANLTQNGLDEGREIGIVAPVADFGEGAATLRRYFDQMWASAQPTNR